MKVSIQPNRGELIWFQESSTLQSVDSAYS